VCAGTVDQNFQYDSENTLIEEWKVHIAFFRILDNLIINMKSEIF